MKPGQTRLKTFCHVRIWPLALACGIAAALSFVRCTSLDPLAGTGSQAGNGRIVGTVFAGKGVPASGAAVLLRRKEYLADTVSEPPVNYEGFRRNAHTDMRGLFSFDSVDTGSYSIEVNDGASHAVLLACSVSENDRMVHIPDDTLRPTGAIKGALTPTPGAAIAIYVRVYGLERVAASDAATGRFIINDVPYGSYSLNLLAPSVDYRPVDIGGVSITSGDTTDIGRIDFLHLSQWRYSRRLYLNTSPAGADVAGTVVNFPVLVRLRTGNFDFTRAKADGGDLRFTKADGTPMPCEIERWDPAAGLAEVWVKTDTVYGNDSSHFIIMYWGTSASSVASISNSQAVFDTMNGFQGTWHLGGTDSLALDATGNRYNGNGHFTAPVAGMIGNARHFNGNSSIIRMNGTAGGKLNFPENGHYSLSAWVYHDTLADSMTYLIAGKGELQYFIKNFDLGLSTPQHERQWEFTEYHGNNIWQAVTFVPASAKTWTYLVGIRDGSNQYLYVNGALAMSGYRVFGTGQDTISRDTTDDFTIGGFLRPVASWNQGYAYFNGAIDEVEVSSMPRSADWIKLSYMNQRADDKLIVFDK